jgi:hypothetical protein
MIGAASGAGGAGFKNQPAAAPTTRQPAASPKAPGAETPAARAAASALLSIFSDFSRSDF